MTTSIDELHVLIAGLSEAEARLWVAALRDHDAVAWAFLTAPIGDEPETAEESAAVTKARKQVARGKVTSHDALTQELGW